MKKMPLITPINFFISVHPQVTVTSRNCFTIINNNPKFNVIISHSMGEIPFYINIYSDSSDTQKYTL
jgi:hypothetical protein